MQNSVRQVIGQIPPYIFADASLVIDVTYLCCMRVCVVRSSQIIRKRAHSTDSIVCTFFKFDSEEEAVKAANNTSMGLASYCFTKNVDRLWRMFENLEAGMIGLNTGE